MPGTIGVMPAHLPDDGSHPAIFTTKVVGVFPDASPSVNGVIVVQDATSGTPLATVDAAAVTALRTAAGSGLSIDLLSRRDATTLALVGAGVQARAHLQAAMAVRDIRHVRVWNRTPERARQLCKHAAGLPGVIDVTVHDTPDAAATGADLICVCTNSPTEVLGAGGVDPGTHVTAIGAYRHDTRELAADLMAAATAIVVDDRAAAAEEAGDILLAIAEGAIGPDAVTADLAQLVGGAITIRRGPEDITIYKSVGTSAMDAVAVRHLLAADAAERAGGPLS
jgi:ornithine cyclodeaminase